MVGTIVQRDLDVHQRVAGQHAGLHGALDALVDCGPMYSFGMAPPTTGVDELVALARFVRLDLDLDVAVLAFTAGLTGVLGDPDRPDVRMVSLVGNLRCAHVGLHLELAQQAVDDDLQVELAHAAR